MNTSFLDEFEFFTGVPDSLLRPLCDYLIKRFGISDHHIIAANEGNAVAIAAGYYLSTGKIPVVYLQNSGIGNMTNPIASLLNDKVYGIPCLFIIGWRGEPGKKDEPEHIFQGEITIQQLSTLKIETFIITNETMEEELTAKIKQFHLIWNDGKQAALLIQSGALKFEDKIFFKNNYDITREEAIRHILAVSQDDVVVSTTGKTSRELYEIRENNQQSHQCDFLTIGSMGHNSSIALGIALFSPNKKIWCIDGDGALLMHMGSLALIGDRKPKNMIHIVMNNGAHESVGGMPTVAQNINLSKVALSCGYPMTYSIDNYNDLDFVLSEVKRKNELSFIEIKCAIGARDNLGRPKIIPQEAKHKFMNYLKL